MKKNKIKIDEMMKFLFVVKKSEEISVKLSSYFLEYYNFCFDIINKNMIKDLDNLNIIMQYLKEKQQCRETKDVHIIRFLI